jgi:hypothetical protein
VSGKMRHNVFRLWPLAIVAVGFVLYWYSLRRTLATHDDFPWYYAAGQGVMIPKGKDAWYVISPKLLPTFSWMRDLAYQQAFTIAYVTAVVSFWLLMRRLLQRLSEIPCTVICVAVVSGVAWIDVLRLGNMGGLLAFAVTTPLGAVLAMLYKPYLVVFVVLHAATFAVRSSAKGANMEDQLSICRLDGRCSGGDET